MGIFDCNSSDLAYMLESIDIELSGACNARCSFCPRDKMMREKKNMPPEVLEKLIREIAFIRPDGPKAIFFSGFGEPLLNENLFLFAQMITDAFPKVDLILVSNGGLLDKGICDQLLESSIHTFSCSFQSLDKRFHESRMVGVEHDNVLRWLNYLAENGRCDGIKIATTCVVTDQDEKELQELRSYWGKRGVSFEEGQLHNRGGFLGEAGTAERWHQQCMLFNSRIFIAGNGDLLACCNDIDGSTKLGSIVEQSLQEILLKKIEVVKSRKLFSICSRCNDASAQCSVDNLLKIAFHCHQKARSLFWAEEHLSHAFALEPNNRDVLFHCGTFFLHCDRYDEALRFLSKALSLYPDDPLVHNSLGAVYRKIGRLEDAVAAFEQAARSAPGFVGAIANLGDVLAELGRITEAEKAYLNVLENDSKMSEVWAALGNVLWRQGRYADAEGAYKKLLEIDPSQIGVYNCIGGLAWEQGRVDDAVAAYLQAIASGPDSLESFCRLGELYLETGRFDDSESILLQAIAMVPENVRPYSLLSHLFRVTGRHAEAESYALKVLEFNPDDDLTYCNLGNIYFETDRLSEAEAAYRTALSKSPDSAIAYSNLGNVFLALGRFDEAREAYLTALAIDPFFVDAYCNISSLYRECSQLEAAEEACREALLLDPDSAESLNNLSAILLDLGRLEEAGRAARQAIALKPAFAEAYSSLGNVLANQELLDEAVDAYQSSLQCNPNYAEALSNLGNVLIALGRYEEAESALSGALELKPSLHACRIKRAMLALPLVVGSLEGAVRVQSDFSSALDELQTDADHYGYAALGAVVGALQPFNLAYRLGDHKELLCRYGDIICEARAAWLQKKQQIGVADERAKENRIRLLIVSGHIRRHSVWDVILHGLLRNINRERFEIIVFHTSVKTDEETEKARELADHFVQGPADWICHLAERAPDIIFYPEVGMDAETIKLASLRLAPLQVASWGHPITSGLPTIDLFLSGELLEHQGADSDYRERLVRLPGTGACSLLMPYQAKAPVSDKFNSPHHIDSTKFLICQQAIKFDPAFDEVYPLIAQNSGPCCFYFVRDRKFRWASDMLEKRIAKTFKDAGMAPEDFISFVEWLPGDEFWGLMDIMDIYLDIPAFSGYTTAWQAVHRGLPVVTCEGRYLRQRLAGGLLRKIGVTETIASGIEEYVDIASGLANSPDERKKLQKLLHKRAVIANEDIDVVRAFEAILLEQHNNAGEVKHANDN